MQDKKHKTAEELAEEFAEIACEHLSKLPDDERETRISKLEKRATTISRRKYAADSTTSSSSCTPAIPAYARDRERS